MVLRNWPLSALRVRTPQLELVYPDDQLLDALADLAAAGIHDPATMPFAYPWTDVAPPQQQRNTLQHHWKVRAEHRPDAWTLDFAVLVRGEPVGMQGLMATEFAVVGAVETGSWLGRPYQRAGLGREMRSAVLHLAFAGLGAVEARSGAFHDNAASMAVSAHFGYEEVGRRRVRRRDGVGTLVGFVLTRERWELTRRDDIALEGVDASYELLGATPR